jgi:hypothetical protein
LLIFFLPTLGQAQNTHVELRFPDEIQADVEKPFQCKTPSFLDLYKYSPVMGKLLRFIEAMDSDLAESMLMQISVIQICLTSNLQIFPDDNDILPKTKSEDLKLDLFQLGIRYRDSVLISESNFAALDDHSKAFFFFHELLHSYFKSSPLKMVRLRTFVKTVAQQYFDFSTEFGWQGYTDLKSFDLAKYKSQFETAKSENRIQTNYYKRTYNSLSRDLANILLGLDLSLDQKLFFGSWDKFTLWLTVNLQNRTVLDYMIQNSVHKKHSSKQTFFTDLWEVFFFPNSEDFCRKKYFDLTFLTKKICNETSFIAPDYSFNENALTYLISTAETHHERVKAFATIQFLIRPTRYSPKIEQQILTQFLKAFYGGSSARLGQYLDDHIEEFYAFLNSQEKYELAYDFPTFRQRVLKEGSLKILRKISQRQKTDIHF